MGGQDEMPPSPRTQASRMPRQRGGSRSTSTCWFGPGKGSVNGLPPSIGIVPEAPKAASWVICGDAVIPRRIAMSEVVDPDERATLACCCAPLTVPALPQTVVTGQKLEPSVELRLWHVRVEAFISRPAHLWESMIHFRLARQHLTQCDGLGVPVVLQHTLSEPFRNGLPDERWGRWHGRDQPAMNRSVITNGAIPRHVLNAEPVLSHYLYCLRRLCSWKFMLAAVQFSVGEDSEHPSQLSVLIERVNGHSLRSVTV